MMPKLRVDRISHVYETGKMRVKALEDINLDIYENEFVTIIGPSGCGKTTLLKIIAGFIKPTSGRVLCDGKEITGPGPDRVYVFQEDAVFPWMTVKENIEIGLIAKGVPKEEREKITRNLIKLVGLEGFENAWPKELSGGMLKRVEVARAYAVNPTILLMDEPFGPLDAQTRAVMQDELYRIWSEAKKTVLFVTHDLDEAIYLATRVVVFSKRPGKVEEVIKVDLPRERSKELKFTTKFLDLKRRVSKAIGYL